MPSNVNRAGSDVSTTNHWTTEKYEIRYRRKDEGQGTKTNAEPFTCPTTPTKKMHNKGEGGKKKPNKRDIIPGKSDKR